MRAHNGISRRALRSPRVRVISRSARSRSSRWCSSSASLGDPGATRGQILAENKQVKKLVAAFSCGPARRPRAKSRSPRASSKSSSCRRASSSSAAAPAAPAYPRSIRRRASAPTSSRAARSASSTASRTCSSTRSTSITRFCRGYRADRLGNVQFRGGNQNFNPSFAKAAQVRDRRSRRDRRAGRDPAGADRSAGHLRRSAW